MIIKSITGYLLLFCQLAVMLIHFPQAVLEHYQFWVGINMILLIFQFLTMIVNVLIRNQSFISQAPLYNPAYAAMLLHHYHPINARPPQQRTLARYPFY